MDKVTPNWSTFHQRSKEGKFCWTVTRINYVQRKGTTSNSKRSGKDFEKLKIELLEELKSIVAVDEIPTELIMNWDHTGHKIVPTSSWSMKKSGEKRVEIVGVNDHRKITAIFCGMIYGLCGNTDHCHLKFKFPDDWDITHFPNHWSTEETMVQCVKNTVEPVHSNHPRAKNIWPY